MCSSLEDFYCKSDGDFHLCFSWGTKSKCVIQLRPSIILIVIVIVSRVTCAHTYVCTYVLSLQMIFDKLGQLFSLSMAFAGSFKLELYNNVTKNNSASNYSKVTHCMRASLPSLHIRNVSSW